MRERSAKMFRRWIKQAKLDPPMTQNEFRAQKKGFDQLSGADKARLTASWKAVS